MASQPVNVDRILKAIRGGDVDIGHGEAFALLAAFPYPQREELLGGVLQDRHESPAIRSAAAIALGRIPTRDSERILLANLRVEEPFVQANVLRALGRIGGREALAAVDALRLPAQEHSKDAAAFSAALIAHRLGLEGHEQPLPPEERMLKIPAERSQPVGVSTLASEQAAKVITDLAQQPYGIEYDREKLVRLECAGRVNVVCPNRTLSAPDGVARLAQRKALAGVAALQSPETGNYSVSYVFLTRPSGAGGIEIMAHRCSGTLALAGTGTVSGARVGFELRSVRRPGVRAISVKGDIEDGQIHVTEAASSTTREKSREPARLVV